MQGIETYTRNIQIHLIFQSKKKNSPMQGIETLCFLMTNIPSLGSKKKNSPMQGIETKNSQNLVPSTPQR